MARELTVKNKDGSYALNNEGIKYLLRLYELAYNIDVKKEYNKRYSDARKSKPIMLNKKECPFCKETRCLQRAHIIPIESHSIIQFDKGVPDILKHALYMCSLHHYAYDKYLLNDIEKDHIKSFLKAHRYTEVIGALYKESEIAQAGDTKSSNRMLESAWSWWRNYCYGN